MIKFDVNNFCITAVCGGFLLDVATVKPPIINHPKYKDLVIVFGKRLPA